MRTRFVVLIAVAILLPGVVRAQEKNDKTEKNKFLVKVNGAQVRTEEYVITRNAKEYKVKSKMSWPAESQVLEQEQTLEPDFTLKNYTLYAADARGVQTIQAKREKDAIRITVRVPWGANQTGTVPMAARVIVLDNMVVSHFQVLLDSFGGQPPAATWGFVIPQQLSLVPGGVTQLPREEHGTLNSKPVTLRKYSINAGGLIMECWADANYKLMRVWVPTQKVEFVREGFVFGAAAAAPAGS